MAAITNGQLVTHLVDNFITSHLQNPGISAIDDFHTVLGGRVSARFNSLGLEGTAATTVVGGICAVVSAAVTGVALAIAVPIGALIHFDNQTATLRNVDSLKTSWRRWWRLSYCAGWRETILRQADQFAMQTRRQNPSLMDTNHYPDLERRFLEYAGAPCQAYTYVSLWNHIAYHWDRACIQYQRESMGQNELDGPHGFLMPVRTLGPRDDYGAFLPSATDTEALRPGRDAMPGDYHRMAGTAPPCPPATTCIPATW